MNPLFLWKNIAIGILVLFGISPGAQSHPLKEKDVLYAIAATLCGKPVPEVSLSWLVEVHDTQKQLWKTLPRTMKTLQRCIEKKTAFSSCSPTLLSFFTLHQPLTVEGWYHYLSLLKKTNRKSLSREKRKFATFLQVGKGTLTRDLLSCIKPFLEQDTLRRRVAYLLWENNLEKAEELMNLLKYSPLHPLRLAKRFLLKDALLKDTSLQENFNALSNVEKRDKTLVMARIRFGVRAPDQALASANLLKTSDLFYYAVQHPELKPSFGKLFLSVLYNLVNAGTTRPYTLEEKQCLQHMLTAQQLFKPEELSCLDTCWSEYIKLQGILWLYVFDAPKKALECFSTLCEFPLVKTHPVPLRSLILHLQKKPPHFPGTPEYLEHLQDPSREKVSAWFWSGLCYEALHQPEKARAFFLRAATRPFRWYGQLATYKLGQSIKLCPPKAPSETHCNADPVSNRIFTTLLETLKDLCSSHIPQSILEDGLASCFSKPCLQQMLGYYSGFKGTTAIARTVEHYTDVRTPQAYPMPRYTINFHDPALIYAIILSETCFDPLVVSSANAKGIMQIMPKEAGLWYRKLTQQCKENNNGFGLPPGKQPQDHLFDPQFNIHLGVQEVKNKLEQFDRRYIPTILAYNAGDRPAKKWLERQQIPNLWFWLETIPYMETRSYVKRVLQFLGVYRAFSGTFGPEDMKKVLSMPPPFTLKEE